MTNGKIVLPQIGKLFHSIKGSNMLFKVCRGYFETETFSEMSYIIDKVLDDDEYCIKLIGTLSKINVVGKDTYVYRQRVYFDSIIGLIYLCRKYYLSCKFDSSYKLTVDDVVNCKGELQIYDKISRKLGLSIESWVTSCCMIQVTEFLESNDVRVENGIKVKNEYLAIDKAPLLYKFDSEKRRKFK